MKNIYIILTHSGTIPSKIVKLYTRNKYSHVSISLKQELNEFYSFGRKKLYNPFNGGFIIESKDSKFYKRFKNTKCVLLKLSVTEEQYIEIDKIIDKYKKNINIYKYDFLGIIFRLLRIKVNRKNHLYCTKFVREVLEIANVYTFRNKFITPDEFMKIPNIEIIYSGKLLGYLWKKIF